MKAAGQTTGVKDPAVVHKENAAVGQRLIGKHIILFPRAGKGFAKDSSALEDADERTVSPEIFGRHLQAAFFNNADQRIRFPGIPNLVSTGILTRIGVDAF